MKKILLLSVLLITTFFAEAQILLRVKLKKGDTYTQKTVKDRIVHIMGMEVIQKKVAEVHSEVIEVADKESKIKTTIKRIYMHQNNPVTPMEFDSDKPDSLNSPSLCDLRTIEGQTFVNTLDELGNIIKTEGSDPFEMLPISTTLPKEAIKVGTVWVGESNISSQMGDMTSKTIYTLSKIENGVAHIDVKSIYKDTEKNGIGIQTGFFDISLSNGLLSSASLSQDIKVKTNGAEAQVKTKISITTK